VSGIFDRGQKVSGAMWAAPCFYIKKENEGGMEGENDLIEESICIGEEGGVSVRKTGR